MTSNRDIVDAMAYNFAVEAGKKDVNYCRVEPLSEAATQCTVTYTMPGDGKPIIYDLGTVNWKAPIYEPYAEWQAQLCAPGGEIIVITDEKAPWYARLFARLLGLEWKWEEVTHTNVSWTGRVVNTPCIAGEDLPLGSVVVNNNGIAGKAEPPCLCEYGPPEQRCTNCFPTT